MSAIVIVITIKNTVNGIYPYPLAFTTFVQPLTGLLAGLVSVVFYRRGAPLPPLTCYEIGIIVVYGSMQGVETGLTNYALKYLPVATRTMINSMSVFFMMTTARLWGLEVFDLPRLLSAAMMLLGGYFQSQSKTEAGTPNLLEGIAMQLTSIFLCSQRWALAQHVMQRLPPESALGRLNKLQLLACFLPINGLVLLPFTCFFAPDGLQPKNLFQAELPVRMLMVGSGLMLMLYAELQLVKLLSAVAFTVMSTIHQIPIVLAGVLIQNDKVSGHGVCGFACCLIGALIYGAARAREREAAGH